MPVVAIRQALADLVSVRISTAGARRRFTAAERHARAAASALRKASTGTQLDAHERRWTCLGYSPREFRAQLLFVLSTYIGSLDTETAALFNNDLSEKRRQIKIKLSKD